MPLADSLYSAETSGMRSAPALVASGHPARQYFLPGTGLAYLLAVAGLMMLAHTIANHR